MAIWAEIKKALNTDITKPLNIWLNDIQSLVNKNKPWYATYSTNGTILKSLTSPVEVKASYDSYNSLFTFVAPENGVYTLTVTSEITNNAYADSSGGTTFTATTLGVCLTDYQGMILGDNTASTMHQDEIDIDTEDVPLGETKTGTKTAGVFLEKGRRYSLKVHRRTSNNTTGVVLKVASAKITYNKTYVNT